MEWAIRDLTHTTMWATRDGTVEAGDWLLGLATPSTVLITGASPATAKQTANNVHLDNRPANDALKLRDSGSDIALVGDAHYHPGGSPRPSTNDFKRVGARIHHDQQGRLPADLCGVDCHW